MGGGQDLFANVTIFFVRGLSQGIKHADRNYATAISPFTVKSPQKHLTDGMLKKLRILKKGATQPVLCGVITMTPMTRTLKSQGYPSESDDDFDRYRAIVRSVDAQIARFVEGLKTLGMGEYDPCNLGSW